MSWISEPIATGVYGAWPEGGTPKSPVLLATNRKGNLILSWQSAHMPLAGLDRVHERVNPKGLFFRSARSPGEYRGPMDRETLKASVRNPLEVRSRVGRRSFISLLSETTDVDGPAGEWTVGNRSLLHDEVAAAWPFLIATASDQLTRELDGAYPAVEAILFDARKFGFDRPGWSQ